MDIGRYGVAPSADARMRSCAASRGSARNLTRTAPIDTVSGVNITLRKQRKGPVAAMGVTIVAAPDIYYVGNWPAVEGMVYPAGIYIQQTASPGRAVNKARLTCAGPHFGLRGAINA